MWTANCATVVPSSDSKDGKTHFTVANLNNKFHRCIEHETSFRILKSVFADESHFVHHTALTPSDTLGDEGAANHTRFCKTQDGPGFHFWVYGKQALAPHKPQPKKFPARQTREACECLVEQSGLSTECFLFAQQDPKTIDKGVFHNDVISVGNGGFFLCHEKAFLSQKEVLKKLKVGFQKRCGDELQILIIKESELSVKDAVSSYLFNSQLISTTKDKMLLVAPIECEKNPKAKALCKKITADKKNPIDEILFLDLRQSMNNGGGPACLRLRVVLSNEEEKKCNQKVLLNNKTFDFLEGWIKKYYRDKLSPSDLADPKLLQESRQALDELSQFLHLGNIYEFQKN
jgi:succinylarginine dihydrolase